MLAMQGRLDEAWAQNQRAAELDPFGVLVMQDMVIRLTWQGKYDALLLPLRAIMDSDLQAAFQLLPPLQRDLSGATWHRTSPGVL
jgi:hypothetical protein